MAIYTRGGDSGMTSLRGDQARVSKGSLQVSVLGYLDEMNSQLGLAGAMIKSFELTLRRNGHESGRLLEELKELRTRIYRIQRELFEIGSSVAEYQLFDQKDRSEEGHLKHFLNKTQEMERWIDEGEVSLPELRHFILPGGGVGGSGLMVARAVVRRGERELVRWVNTLENRVRNPRNRRSNENQAADADEVVVYWTPVLGYLNRLSDWLFVMGRRVNWMFGEEEQVWQREE